MAVKTTKRQNAVVAELLEGMPEDAHFYLRREAPKLMRYQLAALGDAFEDLGKDILRSLSYFKNRVDA